MKIESRKPGLKTIAVLDDRKTPWFSIGVCFLLQSLNGIQFSVYLTSLWPYLTTLDRSVSLGFFGWIMSMYSVGQLLSSFLFGYWNQKTMSTRHPAICGLVFTTVGNVIYGTLPLFPAHHGWFMLLARVLAGLGNGTLSVLRSYCAMASAPKDRARVMPLGSGAFVFGLSLGPTIQALFIPFGTDGIKIFSVVINMYTAPAFLMVFVSLCSILVLKFYFTETYSGVLSEEKKKDPFLVIPKFDKPAAFSCLYLYFLVQISAMSMEIISAPFTIASYNWTNEEALFYNGLLQLVACAINITNYLLISFTRIRTFDRRVMQFLGLMCFAAFYIFTFPWSFYDGPLDYIKLAPNSTMEDTAYSGGCYRKYEWCAHITRVPLPVYLAMYTIVFSFGFPYMVGPNSINYSEILGPRKQGLMMGLYTFAGSLARSITPLFQSYLFERSGNLHTTILNLVLIVVGLAVMFVMRKRLVPLRMIPKLGVPTPYKTGTLYRL